MNFTKYQNYKSNLLMKLNNFSFEISISFPVTSPPPKPQEALF